MKEKIEPVYLLNTSIRKLYELNYIRTRVFLNLQALDLKNLGELFTIIKKSQTDYHEEERLKIFGQKSVFEVNELFKQANIPVPEYW